MSTTIILIGITVVISFYSFNKRVLLTQLMLNPYLIKNQGEYYRFITSGFIHKDHSHLLWNMFSFYIFGTAVEQYFDSLFGGSGVYYYIVLYFTAIVVSDIPTYFKQKNNPNYNALGASGGIGAVIFVFILLQPLQSICIYFALCMPGFVFGAGYMAYTYYQGRKSNDNISHDAHLYGAGYGLLFCMAVYPTSLLLFYEQVSYWLTTLF
jgi:membrane associated rhomboid family serine protease